MTTSVQRPVIITVLAVVAVLSGLVSLVSAFIVLTSDVDKTAAIAPALVGILYFALAKGLLDGSPIARIAVAVAAVIQVASAIIAITAEGGSAFRSASFFTLALGVIVLVLLFTPAANAHFRSRG